VISEFKSSHWMSGRNQIPCKFVLDVGPTTTERSVDLNIKVKLNMYSV